MVNVIDDITFSRFYFVDDVLYGLKQNQFVLAIHMLTNMRKRNWFQSS